MDSHRPWGTVTPERGLPCAVYGTGLCFFAVAFALCAGTAGHADDSVERFPLTPEEERVIVHKGTERPFSGRFHGHSDAGVYVCRRCRAPLYASASKFESHCGWPSFDDEIEGAVQRIPDADGRRTEIVCSRCDAHLGHVFLGEGFTPKNTRHCVNSVSLDFVPLGESDHLVGRAVFAAGCFWGVEYYLKRAPGVLVTRAGYTGGHVESPTYRQVCAKTTGHVEAVEVTYDTTRTDFRALATLFFEIHDPTQVDRQGPDIGEQYRSAVFAVTPEQRRITEELIGILRDQGYRVATRIEPSSTFWPAEDYHQDYYDRKGGQPYCHVREKRF
jgi:peptide methionine sulfoxide reductase msrA/msrB